MTSANVGGAIDSMRNQYAASAAAADDDGFEDVRKNKKNKKKMQKVNPNLLGFQCNADSNSLNRDGGLESVPNKK